MSLIDDLKSILEKTSIQKNEIEKVIVEITQKYGGQYPYIRIKAVTNYPQKKL